MIRKLIFLALLFPVFAYAQTPIYPPALQKGDTVALLSSASRARSIQDIKLAKNRLENLGLKVIEGKSIYLQHGYFAGSDSIRATDINDMFANPEVKAIFEVRGGWGSARLLENIDFTLIKNNPKIIIGFSDITTLLLAIQKQTGLITFHGPMAASYDWTRYTRKQLQDILFDKKAASLKNPAGKKTHTITPGKCTAEILGGNLSVIVSMIGTPYLPSFDNKILFVEDIGEEMYKIDRMMNQLKQAGILSHIKGFIFGTCAHCSNNVPGSFSLTEILEHYITPLNIPSFSGAMIGHQSNMLVIPEGAVVSMDASAGTIQLQRPAVSDNVATP